MTKKISPEARSLLQLMVNNKVVVYRTMTNRAYYYTGEGEYDCTTEFLELREKELIRQDYVDEREGCIWYVPVPTASWWIRELI